jgi:hypothetical protein
MFCQIKGTGSPEVNVVNFSLICEKLLDRPSLPNYGFCSCLLASSGGGILHRQNSFDIGVSVYVSSP